jgi:uncharacterized protein (TIGR02996 family)
VPRVIVTAPVAGEVARVAATTGTRPVLRQTLVSIAETPVAAPISGRVGVVHVMPGQRVTEGQALVELATWPDEDPEEAVLLAGVLAAPDDDGPRLVHADWLMERPAARLRTLGEIIRAQVELATLRPASPRWAPLARRLSDLLAPGRGRWEDRDPLDGTYRRGYLWRVVFHDRLDVLPHLLATAPLGELRVRRLDLAGAKILIAQPRLAQLRRLEVLSLPGDDEAVRLLRQHLAPGVELRVG